MTQENPRRKRLFPQTLGDCVAQVTKPIFKERGLAEMRVIRDWKNIVGHELASYCLPKRLTFSRHSTRDGTLVISVSDGGVAMQLHYMTPQILEKLSRYFGYNAVSRISIIQTLNNSS
jgi:hypothetical protein